MGPSGAKCSTNLLLVSPVSSHAMCSKCAGNSRGNQGAQLRSQLPNSSTFMSGNGVGGWWHQLYTYIAGKGGTEFALLRHQKMVTLASDILPCTSTVRVGMH